MVSIRHSLRWLLVLAAALFMTGGIAQATVLYTGTMALAAADPTQLGRLSRNGISQDWTGGEPYPGVVNPATSYHYTTLDLDLGALEVGFVYGGYIQIEFDSVAATTFLSAYQNAYAPVDKAANWLGDPGTSGNYFGTDPLFFQVIVPGSNHLLLVLNESVTNGGLGLPGTVTVEAFSDTMYTDLAPVPEASTWALMLCGMTLLYLARRKSS